ncbi:MAG: hypothetical protein LLG06_20580, partial [Desulfobacteraceae bacterium]|nr:hypothetical protein [Desulfobacteraceae bacterium]
MKSAGSCAPPPPRRYAAHFGVAAAAVGTELVDSEATMKNHLQVLLIDDDEEDFLITAEMLG